MKDIIIIVITLIGVYFWIAPLLYAGGHPEEEEYMGKLSGISFIVTILIVILICIYV